MFIMFFGDSEIPREPFQDFLDLPDLVRNALAWATQQQIAGIETNDRDVIQHIKEHYDVNQTMTVVEIVETMIDFIQSSIRCRMVRCYVDYHCDIVAAKLAWHDGY